MSKEEKADKVKQLAGELKEAELVVVADYSSFDVKALHSLRGRLRGCDAAFRVVKNNILRRAMKEIGAEEMAEHLVGPNAVTISKGDAAAALKEMSVFLKENDDVRKAKQEAGKAFLKVGLLDGKLVERQGLLELAQLPPRQVILGILAGTLQAPLSGLARALNGIVGGLAFALKDLAGKGGAPKAEVKAEEKKEEGTGKAKAEEKQVAKPEDKQEEPKQEKKEDAAAEKGEAKPAEEKKEEGK